MTDDLVPEPTPAAGDPQTPGGAAPTVAAAQPPKCTTRTRWYRDGRVAEEGFAADGLSERLAADEASFVWLDLLDPDEADLAVVVQEFGLHPLAVEDAISDHQRPKLDRYPTHLFSNVYAVVVNGSALDTSEISAFITARAFITVRKSAFDVDTLIARWDRPSAIRPSGVGFLVHGFFDAVVDGQYEAVEDLGDRIDDLEGILFEPGRRVELRREGFATRRQLGGLRRIVSPMREVIGRLLRDESDRHLVTDELRPYYQDVFDHVLSATEDLDSARERVASVLDTNLNEQGYDLNQITKKLAGWAAIIAVPTAVTGFYGQNVPYPGFGKEWGFVDSAVLTVVLAVGLYLLLRWRRWL